MGTINKHSPEIQEEFNNLYQLIQKLQNELTKANDWIEVLKSKMETK